jgi:hypothetical protein
VNAGRYRARRRPTRVALEESMRRVLKPAPGSEDGQPLRSNVVPANPEERPVHSSFPISAKWRLPPLTFHL